MVLKILIYLLVSFITICIGYHYTKNDNDNERFSGILLIGITWPISFIIAIGFYFGFILVTSIDIIFKK